MSITASLARNEGENREYALVTVVATTGSTARSAGTKMIVYPDGSIEGAVGGGIVEHEAKIDARAAMESGAPLLKEYEITAGGPKGDTLAGTVTCFIEPFVPSARLYLLGAGHVAQEIIPVAKLAGFHVTVIDPREGLSKTEKAAMADRFILAEYDSIDTMTIPAGSYFMLGTYDHGIDGQLLARVLRRGAAYVGMLGGKPKIRAIFKSLREQGYTEEELSAAHTPAGLDIGAEDPAQIAISVVAEMLAVKNGCKGGFCREKLAGQV